MKHTPLDTFTFTFTVDELYLLADACNAGTREAFKMAHAEEKTALEAAEAGDVSMANYISHDAYNLRKYAEKMRDMERRISFITLLMG